MLKIAQVIMTECFHIDEITFFLPLPGIIRVNKLLVDCEWAQWVLGECSKTCGGGERTNLRDKKIRERNGGTCSGTPTDTETCNVDFCPGIRFFFYQCVTK